MQDDKNELFDVCVVGGGPAGIMAALSVKKHHPEKTVVILDRTFELARKLLIIGAGRGNLTNVNLKDHPERFYFDHKDFVASVFSQFSYADIIQFLENLGLILYEEVKSGRGKIFPTINHAKTVRDMLVDEVAAQKIEIRTNTEVTQLIRNDTHWQLKTNESLFSVSAVILTAGGCTYPALGSNGSGYALVEALGHTIITPVPSAVPLVSKNLLSHLLQGETAKMKVTSIIDSAEKDSAVGEVMFTQYGLSGPAIFDVSRDISIHINRNHKNGVLLYISFFPDVERDVVEDMVSARISGHPHYPISHVLWGLLTEKCAAAICEVCQLPKELVAGDLTPEQLQRMVKTLTSYEVSVTGTRGWNEAEFATGGVDISEVDVRSLSSKKVHELYFAGEVLDIDGMVGGYNLSWAWTSGWLAGKLL
jgi:predicted Rossmann fold flavoprotein